MPVPNEFFTLAFLTTFAGATLAVTVVTAAIGYLFPRLGDRLKFVAAVLSVLLMLFLAWTQHVTPVEYVLALLNGFIVFMAVMGVNTTFTKPLPGPVEADVAELMEQKRFWRRW